MEIFVTRGAQQFGPYSSEQVQEYLGNGQLIPTDTVWYEGLDGWKPITSLFQAPPRVPPLQKPAPVVPTSPTTRRATTVKMDQSHFPSTPGRPASQRRPAPASQRRPAPASQRGRAPATSTAPQKRSPWLWVAISFVSLVTLWLGITLVFGLLTKSQFEKSHQQNRMASLGSYKMGLFSSQATTLLHFGDTDNVKDAMNIRHRIHHGPFVLSEQKKGFGVGSMTTSFDLPAGKSDRPGVSMLSEVNFSGRSNHSLVIDPIDLEQDLGHLVFGGGSIDFKSNPELSEVEGAINLSPIKLTTEDGEMTIAATKGTLDYRSGGFVEIDLTIGGLRYASETEAGKQILTIEPPRLDAKYHYHSKDLPLYVGKSSLTFPEMRIEGMMPVSLRDLEFSSRANIDSAINFASSTRFEIGGAMVGDPAMPMFDLDKTSLELGYKGLDAKLMAELSAENRQLYGAQFKTAFDAGDLASIQSNAELQESANRAVGLWLDLIRPGAELFAKVRLSGTDGLIDLNGQFGGAKKLTDTKSLREALSALEAGLKIQVKGELLESPLVAMSIQGYAEGGLGKLDKNGFQLDGAVRKGTVYLGEEATPILESLGPILDEPINWQEILAAINAGDPDA